MPATYDVHHVVHLNATADLPFGHGKAFANNNAVLDKIIGGWNVGTIGTIESGFPFRITGGYSTYNTQADGGLVLKGVTPSQLQSSVGVYRIPGATFVTLIDPKYLAVSNPSCLQQWVSGCSISGTNTAFIDSNTTPGTYNQGLTLYGPHGFFQDIAVTKNVPIGERFRFNLQGVFLNAWNHPVFGNGATPISGNPRTSGFATTGSQTVNPTSNTGSSVDSRYGRQVELRANFIF
jgi:hypothetical protein